MRKTDYAETGKQTCGRIAVACIEWLEAMCEICQNWARTGDRIINGKMLPTNHHPKCLHYNDSLIEVWKVTHNGVSHYADTEIGAEDMAEMEGSGDTIQIVKEKMHREIFDNLPEFEGF